MPIQDINPDLSMFTRVFRFDEFVKNGVEDNSDPNKITYIFDIPSGLSNLFVVGVGGGGGGGGGASGRGPEKDFGGGGAGGNGTVNNYENDVRHLIGSQVKIVIGEGGLGGAGAIGTDQFGSNGGDGQPSFILLGDAQIYMFNGASGGQGGHFRRDGTTDWGGGLPGNAYTTINQYYPTLGGVGGILSRPPGNGQDAIFTNGSSQGGVAGIGPGAGGGGGGGASRYSNGARGGNYGRSDQSGYGVGANGSLGAGGGGGAGGGPHTSDNGGKGGNGGMGYVWFLVK